MNKNIAIIGLGYVGLPLAVEFAKQYKTIGFDIIEKRTNELNNGIDSTLEVKNSKLQKVLVSNKNHLLINGKGLFNTTLSNDLKEFGVDSDAPDLFSSETENSTSEDLLSSNVEYEEDDLEIPAFLRRQKN